MGAVKSRINTGLSNAPAVEPEKDKKFEAFTGHMQRSVTARKPAVEKEKRAQKMSFKQRRDLVKEQSAGKSSSNE
jgi:hypothetical protein